jgi:MFS family permease
VEKRQIPFLVGLVLLTSATGSLCLARSLAFLLMARISQGLSGSIVWTVAIAIMTDRVGTQKFGFNMALLTVARSAGVLVGPLLGGVLYARAGYYAVFATAFGFLAIDILCRCLLIEAREAQKWDPSISPVSNQSEDATDSQGEQEDTEPVESATQSGQGKGSLCRLAHRLPPFITLLGSIRLLVAIWGCFIQALMFGCMDAVIPLFVKGLFNWDSFGAGLVFLALIAPTFVSPVFGWLADKHGPRWYASGGLLIMAVPLALLCLIADNSVPHKAFLCILLGLVGALSTCFEIPLCVEVVLAVELKGKENPKQYGGKGAYAQAFGLNNMTWAAGMVVGPLWGGFIFQNAGWGVMSWSLALLAAVSAIPSAIWVGGSIFDRSQKRDISSSSSRATLVDGCEEKGEVNLQVKSQK